MDGAHNHTKQPKKQDGTRLHVLALRVEGHLVHALHVRAGVVDAELRE